MFLRGRQELVIFTPLRKRYPNFLPPFIAQFKKSYPHRCQCVIVCQCVISVSSFFLGTCVCCNLPAMAAGLFDCVINIHDLSTFLNWVPSFAKRDCSLINYFLKRLFTGRSFHTSSWNCWSSVFDSNSSCRPPGKGSHPKSASFHVFPLVESRVLVGGVRLSNSCDEAAEAWRRKIASASLS